MTLLRDLRHALRQLAANPGFTVTAVLTLAVALGANTVMFGLVHGILLRPLPFPQPERVVAVSARVPPGDGRPERSMNLDRATLDSWRRGGSAIRGLAELRGEQVTLTGSGRPRRLHGVRTAADLFSLVGVSPVRGRVFGEDAERSGSEPVVVLSHRLWRELFEADDGVVGERLSLDGVPHTVLGVMPKGFHVLDPEVEVWLPLRDPVTGGGAGTVSVEFFPAVARLADGVSLRRAEEEAERFVHRAVDDGALGRSELAEAEVVLTPLSERMVAAVRPALAALSLAVALVLGIAWVNLANLLLARNAFRRREFAIRMALGGDRLRLARQVLTESTLLGLVGGVAGTLLAAWVHRLLPALLPADVPRLEQVRFDGTVLLFALGASVATGLAVGLLSVLRGSRQSLVQPLHGAVTEDRRERRTRGLLVMAEVALAAVLLVGAGFLLQGFRDLVRVDLGYEPAGVLTAELDLGGPASPAAGGAVLAQIVERLVAHPAVEEAGVVSYPPLTPLVSLTNVEVVGHPRDRRLAVPQLTSPGYREALGLRMVEGRWLTGAEHAAGEPVAVVNQAFAREYLGELDATRQQVRLGPVALRVVGVVEDALLHGFDSEPRPEVYASFRHAGAIPGASPDRFTLALRGERDAASLAAPLREIVAEIAPGVLLEDVATLEARLAASVAGPRTNSAFSGAFALIAVILAAAGIYGLVAASVAGQRRSIGVRRALGAERRHVLAAVLRRGMLLVLGGLAVGLGASALLLELVARRWIDVTPGGLGSFALAALVILAVALVASLVPARRALRIQPLEALRAE